MTDGQAPPRNEPPPARSTATEAELRPLRVGIVGTGEMGRPLVHRLRACGTPLTADKVAVAAAARGVAVVDAPASGGPDRVAAGTLTLFVGGADEHIRRCLALFSCYASNVATVGPLGAGQKDGPSTRLADDLAPGLK